MDRLTISSAQGMGADFLGLAAQRRRSGKPGEDENQALAAPRRPDPPQAVATATEAPVVASAVAADLGQQWPPLNAAEAKDLLDELVPAVAASHPLKLAELQPVTERSLVPTAYV